MALAMLAMALWLGNRKSRTYRTRLAMSSLLLMAIGCGGGGSSDSGGSTGGGTSPPVNSTVTMTLADSKTTPNARVNATATVTSSKTPTGQVQFLAQDYLAVLTALAPLTNGSATSQLPNLGTGIYQVYAEYTGDSFTKASRSATVPLTVTGDGFISINATNGPVSHATGLEAQVQ
jgi:hypothetical protein